MKNLLKPTIIIFLMLSIVFGQDEKGSPDEDRSYFYLSTNLLRATHTLSMGYWGSSPKLGMNITALYYGNIEYIDWVSSEIDPDLTIQGPSYLSISTSIRYKADQHLSEYSGVGLSYNILEHGNDLEYDKDFSFTNFTPRPRSPHVVFDRPYATFFIENGYMFSSKALSMVFGVVFAWHPLVFETWKFENEWNAKGYFVPYNFQLRLELGVKKVLHP